MFNVICVPVLIRSCRFAAAINPVMRRFSQSAPNYSPNKTMTKKKKKVPFASLSFLSAPQSTTLMNAQRLKNLISLRSRNASNKLQRTLQELAQNIQRQIQQQQQAPIPVPVPVRHRNTHPLGRRNYSTITQSRW